MEQLVNGKFVYEVPRLCFSEEKICVEINEGEKYQGELSFSASDESSIRGMIASSSRRVVLGERKFTGRNVKILYGIDGGGLFPGDFLQTSIVINSNLGEYLIPVEVRVRKIQIVACLLYTSPSPRD